MSALGAPDNDELQPLLTVGAFGGLDTTTSPYYVSETNYPDMLNFTPNDIYGGYTTALGRVAVGSLPSEPNGIFKFLREGKSEVYLFACDIMGSGGIYSGPLNGPYTPLGLPAPLTAGQQTYFVTSLQWVFITNGVDTPIKIDDDLNVTYWGIDYPTTAPTVAISGVSLMLGTYEYAVTFGSAFQESSQGAISTPITVDNQSIQLSNIPISTDPQVTERNIYRIGGALGTWQLVGTLNDNTTTTFFDTTADSNVNGQILVIHRDPPPPFKYITTHKERIWGWGTPDDHSIVYFSNLNEPWGFNNSTGTRPVGENSYTDDAAGITSIGSVLVLNKRKTTYLVYGNDDTDFQPLKNSDTGCLSGNSVATIDGASCWIDRRGVWMLQGESTQIISDGGYQASNIKNLLRTLSVADLQKAVGFWYDRMYHISLPTINKTYFFDLRSSMWFVLGWACRQVYTDAQSDVPVVTDDQQVVGRVSQWFAAPTDYGMPIAAYIESRVSDSGTSATEKLYRKIEVLAPPQSGTCHVTVRANPGNQQYVKQFRVDLQNGTTRHQVSISKDIRGTEVSLRMSVLTSVQLSIQKVTIYGTTDRALIEQSDAAASE